MTNLSDNISQLVLRSLLTNEQYMRKVIPFMEPDYFENIERNLFKLYVRYVAKYNNSPTLQSFRIWIEEAEEKIGEEDYRRMMELLPTLFDKPEVDERWLLDATEKWCQDRALFNAIMESISIIDGKHKTLTKNALPDVLSKALSVTFDTNIGHDYLENVEQRYDFYHEVEERIPFDLEYLNAITKGGLPNKSLNIALAGCVHPDTKIKVRMRKKLV